MRPDLQQDPRPEFGIPVPRDTDVAGRHDAAAAGPQGPWSGPQPAAGPWTGNTPAPGPYSGPQPAVGPYSGPQPAAGRPAPTGSWSSADRAPAGYSAAAARQAAEPTVRHQQRAETPPYEPTAYEAAPAYESGRYDGRAARYETGGYERQDGHPSGPLPVGSGHRRGTERRAGTGRGRRRAMLALVAAGAIVAGAAGYVAIAKWGATSDQPAAPAAGASVAATSLSGPNLATRQTPLGLVATSDGFTVYEYTKDTNKPSASNCSGSCATSWPPVLASDTPWLKGVAADKVGTVDRPDGTKQLTLNGWPLYRYAKDAQPGDTTGNGVGGTWKALNPDGKPVAPAAGGTAPAAGGSGSGSGSSGSGAASGGSGSAYGSAGSGGGAAASAPAAPAASGDSYGSSGY
jgi:predicted lipoprotein with Yx(FWY)xxD motif